MSLPVNHKMIVIWVINVYRKRHMGICRFGVELGFLWPWCRNIASPSIVLGNGNWPVAYALLGKAALTGKIQDIRVKDCFCLHVFYRGPYIEMGHTWVPQGDSC
jgi:hypothetical protein